MSHAHAHGFKNALNDPGHVRRTFPEPKTGQTRACVHVQQNGATQVQCGMGIGVPFRLLNSAPSRSKALQHHTPKSHSAVKPPRPKQHSQRHIMQLSSHAGKQASDALVLGKPALQTPWQVSDVHLAHTPRPALRPHADIRGQSALSSYMSTAREQG